MAVKGLALFLGGKAKAKPSEEPEPDDADESEASETSDDDDYASLAFDALQAGDKDAFKSALEGAIRACKSEPADEE
jgi:hypothetical protein